MVICQINAVYGISSTGRICKEISDYINKNTNDFVYTFFNFGKNDDFSFKFGSSFDVKIHALLSRFTGLQGHFSRLNTKRLIKRIDSIKPDACILHNIHCNSLNYKILFNYLIRKNIKTFFYLHDCFYFTGKCTYFRNCNKWQQICQKCELLKNDIPSWFVDTSKKLFFEKKHYFDKINPFVIGVSNWITQRSLCSTILGKYNHKTIYNWIDFNVFKSKTNTSLYKKIKDQFKGKKIILGVSGFWSKTKGIDLFIQLSKIIDDNYIILLVGEYDYIDDCNIHFYGSTKSDEELASIYNAADVFLNLSTLETFGLVSAESLSCGTPVICFNTSANPELVREGCGFVLDYNNFSIEDLVLSIHRITQKTKKSYSRQCIECAHSMFDMEKNIGDLHEYIYSQIR